MKNVNAKANSPVTLLHTPRTGGTSIANIVSSNIPSYGLTNHSQVEKLIITTNDFNIFAEKLVKIIDNSIYASFHGGFPLSKGSNSARKLVLTIRDPIERAFSLYTWWRKFDLNLAITDDERSGIETARSCSFSDFVLNPKMLYNLSGCTMQMCSSTDVTPIQFDQDLAERLAAECLDNLPEIDWIMETNTFHLDYLGLFYELGFPPSTMPNVNGSSKEASENEINEYLSADHDRLRYYLRHEFDVYLAASDFRKKKWNHLSIADLEKKCLDRWLESDPKPFFEAGWYGIEVISDMTVRWLGSCANASVLVPRGKKNGQFRVEIISCNGKMDEPLIIWLESEPNSKMTLDMLNSHATVTISQATDSNRAERIYFSGPIGHAISTDARLMSYMIHLSQLGSC